jgi:hypothetical protein
MKLVTEINLIEEIANRIASVRGHNLQKCNERCQCYPLALEIVALVDRTYADDRNRLSEKFAGTYTKPIKPVRFEITCNGEKHD